MAIYRNGKKVTGIYRNGKAITGVYRGGKKLYGASEPEVIQGVEIEVVAYILDDYDRTGIKDPLYFAYALNKIQDNQKSEYVELNLGTKVLRLAGDTIGRIKGIYQDGVVTWSGVTITDEDLYIGKLLDINLVTESTETLYDSATYPETDTADCEFKSVLIQPQSVFHSYVRTYYNSSSDAMKIVAYVGEENITSPNQAIPDFVSHSYLAKGAYSAGTYQSAYKYRKVIVQTDDYDFLKSPCDVIVKQKYKNLVANRQHEVVLENPALNLTLKAKVKGIIK